MRAEFLVPQLLFSGHDGLELEYHSIIQTLRAADHLSVPMRCWWLRCLYATDKRTNSASTGFLLDSKAKVIKLTAPSLSSSYDNYVHIAVFSPFFLKVSSSQS